MNRIIIDNLEEFVQIDKRIDTHEENAADSLRESIRDRWEFGRLMLAERKGKQLPNGMMAELTEATGKSSSELGYRMQFAERYPTEDEVSRPLETCTSWTQVKNSLPKPPEPGKRQPPKPNPGVPKPEPKPQPVAPEAEAPIDWDTVPGNMRDKVERAARQIRKEFEVKLDTALATHKAKLDAEHSAQNAKLNAMRDEERRRYQLGIEVQRAKGLITPSEYTTILSCLHPDSRLSASDEKLAEAFRVFNDPKIKALLVKEIDRKTTARAKKESNS